MTLLNQNNFLGNGQSSQNGKLEKNTIPMQSFPDREQDGINNHDVTTLSQAEKHGNDQAEEGVPFYQTETDDTDGGAGSKMVMSDGSYLGKFLL